MNQTQKNAIRAGGEALHKYQSGESLTDAEMRQARDFAEMLVLMSAAHPDCRVFRHYGGIAIMLDCFVNERARERQTKSHDV